MDAVASLFYSFFAPAKKREQISYKVRYATLFWLFFFGSIAGLVLEGLWCVLRLGRWETHSSTVWGPFCIIYGFGAVAVYLLSGLLRNKNTLVQFIAFTVSGAAVEYFGSLFQELCFGSVSWDYSAHALNLGGRVSLKMALMWGALGILFMRLTFPLLNRLFEKMKGKGWKIACIGMTVFMAVDLLVTAAAVTRWRTRSEGAAAANAAVQWLDDTYDDQTMEKRFPNMQFTASERHPHVTNASRSA